MQNEPGTEYSNEFTRMIERVGGVQPGYIESPVIGSSMPMSRSAAMNVAPPLTSEERAELDARAMDIGVMDRPAGEEGPYGSLEEAQNVGRSVQVPTSSHTPGRQIVTGLPRLPDFAQVGGIDLIRGVVYLDGMEFPIPEGDVAKYRLYVIEIAHADITRRLAEAMQLYAPAPVAVEVIGGGTDEGTVVPEVS